MKKVQLVRLIVLVSINFISFSYALTDEEEYQTSSELLRDLKKELKKLEEDFNLIEEKLRQTQ